ncbi:MAG: LamG-like jellyroll fold domain-containing protein, partial [Planctomycetia bacterium]|nr:LamG-like jellyroll fold domain-containing protein [Planctomycetia bacterium]
MLRCKCVVLLALTATVAIPATLPAAPSLIPFAHYRLGEEDADTPTPGQPPESGLTYDEIKYEGAERDLATFGTPLYSDFASPGGYSSLSMQFDGVSDLFGSATQWHGQPPNTFRIGMEAWVWIDPVMENTEFVPFTNGSGMGFVGTADGQWTTYGTGGFPLAGEIRYGEWQHIAFATNGSQWNFYLDGVQTVFAHGGTYGATSGSISIGGDSNGDRRMTGFVDEARLFRWGNILPNQLNLQIDDLLIYSGLTKGDVNADGIVDATDYDVWRANVGADISALTGIESLELGNVNHDDRIDLDDFGIIKASQTPGASPVPEPSTWVLAGIAAAVVGLRKAARGRKTSVVALVAALGTVLISASPSNAQIAQWNGSNGNWTDANWTGGTGPGGAPAADDTAEFLAGGTATINTDVGEYAQLVTRQGGTIDIAPTGSVAFDNVNLGASGANGAGIINLQGSLNVPVYLSLALGDNGNGNATSQLNISGSGTLRTPTLDAFWATPGARVSMTGPDTDVEVGDFVLGISTFVANITDVTHSPVKATNSFDIFAEGSVLPGSKIEVHFDLGDAAPEFGDSWTLVDTPAFTNAAVGVASGATFKPENVKVDFLDSPGLRGELVYKAGGTLGQVLAVDVVHNLNLKIDPSTGDATLENPTVGGGAFEIDGIMITSASGSLNAAGFDGLGLNGWASGLNQSAVTLSESSLFGSTSIATGATLELGNLFTLGSTNDLIFEYHVVGGTSIRGTVQLEEGPVGPLGDTDDDGDVDITDLNNVRNNFSGAGLGDTDNDNDVDITDLNNVRNNFGAGQPVGSP